MPTKFSPAWLQGRRVHLDPIERDSIIGIGHVMAEVDSLIGRLRRPDLMQALDLEPPRGILLWGQPGLGKTLVARYIATRIGREVPFYEVPSDELTPDRMRGAIRWLAEEHGPSVLYLEELDQWGLRRDDEEHSPDTRLVLLAALAGLDPLVPAAGPIVIASSNRSPRMLDPALVRSGRLGIHIRFDVPAEAERAQLFRLFVGNRPTDGDLDWGRAARLTRGRTPADLKAIVADAYGLAVGDGRPGGRIDDALLAVAIRRGGEIKADDTVNDPSLVRRWAIHEASHVAACVALRGPDWVYAVVLGTDGGTTSYGRDGIDFGLLPDSEQRAAMVVAHAGVVGEQLLLADGSLGAQGDIGNATLIARRRLEAGLDPKLVVAIEGLDSFASEDLKTLHSASITSTLADARDLATRIVEANRAAIEQFAETLEAAGELVGEGLTRAIASAGFSAPPSISTVQARTRSVTITADLTVVCWATITPSTGRGARGSQRLRATASPVWRAAVHEAGHRLVMRRMGELQRDQRPILVALAEQRPPMRRRAALPSPQDVRRATTIVLAGLAAEIVLTGEPGPRGAADAGMATWLLYDRLYAGVFWPTLGTPRPSSPAEVPLGPRLVEILAARAVTEIQEAMVAALRLVEDGRAEAQRMAHALSDDASKSAASAQRTPSGPRHKDAHTSTRNG